MPALPFYSALLFTMFYIRVLIGIAFNVREFTVYP